MSNVLYFYDVNANLRRNIPMFLLKEGFKVVSTSNIMEAESLLERKEMNVVVTDNESNALLVSRVTDIPLVLILEEEAKQEDILSSFNHISNPVFLRFETDSLETIVNTISLGASL